jgi:hypothetical protein
LKAAVSKTVNGGFVVRGFESLSLRCSRRFACTRPSSSREQSAQGRPTERDAECACCRAGCRALALGRVLGRTGVQAVRTRLIERLAEPDPRSPKPKVAGSSPVAPVTYHQAKYLQTAALRVIDLGRLKPHRESCGAKWLSRALSRGTFKGLGGRRGGGGCAGFVTPLTSSFPRRCRNPSLQACARRCVACRCCAPCPTLPADRDPALDLRIDASYLRDRPARPPTNAATLAAGSVGAVMPASAAFDLSASCVGLRVIR